MGYGAEDDCLVWELVDNYGLRRHELEIDLQDVCCAKRESVLERGLWTQAAAGIERTKLFVLSKNVRRWHLESAEW